MILIKIVFLILIKGCLLLHHICFTFFYKVSKMIPIALQTALNVIVHHVYEILVRINIFTDGLVKLWIF
jgi:hypothetical protein